MADATPMEDLQSQTGLSRDELVDRATVATLTQTWTPESEALHQSSSQPEQPEPEPEPEEPEPEPVATKAKK